jgi:hypothetical protein
MKSILFFFLLLFGMGINLWSQKKPEVAETTFQYQDKKLEGFKTSIPEAKPDQVEKNWIKTIERGTRSKVDLNNTYNMSLMEARIKDVSDSVVDVFSKIEASDSMVYLYSSFVMNDVYIKSSSYSAETALVKDFLFQFAKEQYEEAIKEELKVEETKLKDLEKELDRTVKDKEKMEKDIAGYNSDILEAKNEIMNLEHSLEMTQESLNNQKVNVNSISKTDKEARKAAESTLKGHERDKKKIYRDIEKLQKDIVDYENRIQQNRIDIQSNMTQQVNLTDQINAQSEVVQAIELKLSNLKDMRL